MNALVEALIQQGLTISTVESFTGGLMASRLTSIAGVSAVYRGSLVVYNESVKVELLDLDPVMLAHHGTISAYCAKVMAQAGQKKFKSDVCIALSGNAGPTALENQPVGQWYACIVFRDTVIETAQRSLLDRNALREAAVETCAALALELIRGV